MADLLEVSLATSDLDRSRRFFEEALALDPEHVGETSVSYRTGRCELKLQADFPPEVRETFALREPVEDRGVGAMFVLDLEEPLAPVHDRVVEAAGELGARALVEPREVPWGVKMFLARSPEGYLFEVRGADS